MATDFGSTTSRSGTGVIPQTGAKGRAVAGSGSRYNFHGFRHILVKNTKAKLGVYTRGTATTL
jgi:hypothetical protein